MFCARLGSFNQLEQLGQRNLACWRRWLGGHLTPCVDEISYVSERMDPDALRRCLGHIHARLKRNKVLGLHHGMAVANIDGHEIFSSYHRCCDQCLQRELEVGGKTRVQYYHRLVGLQIVGPGFELMLDAEMQRPGEDEIAAALRLVARVLDHHPRCFDILCADAIYLRPSVLRLLDERGKHLLAVLKANQPDLLAEARVLTETSEPVEVLTTDKPDKKTELRDMEGFTTDTITEPLRVVRSTETTDRRHRAAREWEQSRTESQWYWATTLPQSQAGAKVIHDFGHGRWRIENEGFNELVTHWHADHCYHHHVNSILVLWLILFMAHAVFHCWLRRNVKPAARAGHSTIHFAGLIGASLRTQNWWPPPT
jgi:hypothetical protein